MASELAISAYVVLGGAAAVSIAFTFPSLTIGGASSMQGISQAAFEVAQEQEMAYCQRRPAGMNCKCFAETAGMIRAYQSPQAMGYSYMNKKDLARSQARQRC